MKSIHQTIYEIEDLMMKRERARWNLQEKVIGHQWRKLIFALVGFKILARPLTTTAILCLLGWFALAILQKQIGAHVATHYALNGIFFTSLFLGVSTTPSSYPTLNIDNRNVEGYLSIIRQNGMGQNRDAIKFIAEEIERYSCARTRRWLGLVALVWSLYIFETTLAARAGRSLPEGITLFLVGTCIIVLTMVWSYGKAASQLVAILRACEAHMTGNPTQGDKS